MEHENDEFKVLRIDTLSDYIKRLSRIYGEEELQGYLYRDIMRELYSCYQVSELWQNVVKAVKERSNGLCAECGKTPEKGVVHHKSYSNWGKGDKEEINDCIYLCSPCHNKEHKKESALDTPFWAKRNHQEIRLEIIEASPFGEL